MVRHVDIPVTGPAGTAVSGPVAGRILEVRYGGTALDGVGDTADYTITRDDGATVLAVTDQGGPWAYAPRTPLHSTGGSALSANDGSIPVTGNLHVAIAGGGTATDDIRVYYEA
jgi:hypothetical protein